MTMIKTARGTANYANKIGQEMLQCYQQKVQEKLLLPLRKKTRDAADGIAEE